MTQEQFNWLSTFDPETGSLSTYGAKDCGYGDMLRAGYVVNRGPEGMPDLFITAAGHAAIKPCKNCGDPVDGFGQLFCGTCREMGAGATPDRT